MVKQQIRELHYIVPCIPCVGCGSQRVVWHCHDLDPHAGNPEREPAYGKYECLRCGWFIVVKHGLPTWMPGQQPTASLAQRKLIMHLWHGQRKALAVQLTGRTMGGRPCQNIDDRFVDSTEEHHTEAEEGPSEWRDATAWGNVAKGA